MPLGTLLDEARTLLGSAAEAEQLISASYRKILGRHLSRLDLYSALKEVCPSEVSTQAKSWIQARKSGTLLQHLIGYQVFLDHEYEVNPHVLVPRPETEVLVQTLCEDFKNESPSLGLEVGVGSGVISIELLSRFPSLHMTATERSPKASEVARANARRILSADSNRLKIIPVTRDLDVVEPLIEVMGLRRADFLVSNPPYLLRELNEVDREVMNQEPSGALFAPAQDPLHFYRKIAEDAAYWVAPGRGRVYLEIPHERANVIVDLFNSNGWKTRVHPDLNDRARVLVAERIK